MDYLVSNAIFWIEVDKIKPNPFQPRREFDEGKLRDLSDSIRQYGVLQPLVVTRSEIEKEDGGLTVEYELIAGERRLRASKLAGVEQVPVIIRSGENDDKLKLELAIIENLQREDLNPVDRARAFQRLVDDFGFKHIEIGKKVGKSREYVSNTLRILLLADDMLDALSARKITEGHTRPLLMLADRPEEQATLFKEIIVRRINVREAEQIARRIAFEKVRKKDQMVDPEMFNIEEKLTEELGTRVQIDRKHEGGKITISFFSQEDLKNIISIIETGRNQKGEISSIVNTVLPVEVETVAPFVAEDVAVPIKRVSYIGASVERFVREAEERARQREADKKQQDDMYFIENFSL